MIFELCSWLYTLSQTNIITILFTILFKICSSLFGLRKRCGIFFYFNLYSFDLYVNRTIMNILSTLCQTGWDKTNKLPEKSLKSRNTSMISNYKITQAKRSITVTCWLFTAKHLTDILFILRSIWLSSDRVCEQHFYTRCKAENLWGRRVRNYMSKCT